MKRTMTKMKLIVAAFLLAFSAMACAANGESGNSETPLSPRDSIVQKALGDSIFNIIANAKTITAEIIGYTDSTKAKTPEVKLSAEDLKIMKFLLRNPQNVSSNDTVFGRVLPNICFRFQYKKQMCQLFFDFGLRKWQVKDKDDHVLKTFDIKSPEFVHLASQLFPSDEYLNELLKQ